MPQFPQNFNARLIEPLGASTILPVSGPEGWPVIFTGSEMVASKNNAQHGMLVLDLKIIEGEHVGEEGKYRLNLFHSNEKTVKIAEQQLSSCCWAVGKPDAKCSEELYNLPLRVVVGYQKLTAEQEEAKSRGEEVTPFTEIKRVLCYDGSAPGKSGNAAPNSAPVPTPPAAPAPTPAPAPQPAAQPQFTPEPAPAGPAATQAPWGAAPQQPATPAQPAAPAAAPWATNPAPATTAAPWQK